MFIHANVEEKLLRSVINVFGQPKMSCYKCKVHASDVLKDMREPGNFGEPLCGLGLVLR